MHILFPLPDSPNNQLCILTPVIDVSTSMKDMPPGVDYKIVEKINVDMRYFGAYEFDKEQGSKVNIQRAKEIHLEHLRKARTPLLEALDVEFMRAVESGNTALQSEIASKKQALRDITSIELPDTLKGIKATWPEILGQNPFK
jgi:hypothetical protein